MKIGYFLREAEEKKQSKEWIFFPLNCTFRRTVLPFSSQPKSICETHWLTQGLMKRDWYTNGKTDKYHGRALLTSIHSNKSYVYHHLCTNIINYSLPYFGFDLSELWISFNSISFPSIAKTEQGTLNTEQWTRLMKSFSCLHSHINVLCSFLIPPSFCSLHNEHSSGDLATLKTY